MSSQGGGGAGGGAGNFPINIQGNAAGLDAIIKSVAQYEAQLVRAALASTNFANSAARVGPALAGSGAGANQFASSMTGANKTLDQFTGSSNTASSGAKTFQSSIISLGQGTGQFANATTQANTSAKGFQSTIVSLGQGTGQFANTTNQANTSAKGFQSTIVGLGQGTGQFAAATNQANTAASGFKQTTIGLGQATGTLKTNLDGTATGFQDMGDTAETAANKTSNSINSAGAAVTSMVGKVSGLFIGFTGLKMAMDEAAGMQEMLRAAQDKVAKATERVNEAIKQYGAGSHQATQATQALEKAQNGLAFAERNTNFAIGDTYYFLAMMSTQILSSVVPALVNWKETKEKLNAAINFLKNNLSELPAKIAAKVAATAADTAAETANGAATNMSGLAKVRATISAIALGVAHHVSAAAAAVHAAAQKGLTAALLLTTNALRAMFATMMAHPIILALVVAIAALVAVLGAIKSDFMGARTAAEGFGKSLGDTVPILKPFLEGIQGIGGALGLTGESAEETQVHFDRMTIGFQNMGTLWNDTVALMQNSNIALVQDVGYTAAGITLALQNMNNDFDSQIAATTATWNKFVDALSKGDFSGAVDILSQSLSAIPGILSRIGQRFTELNQEIAKGLKAIGTDLYKELAKVSEALQGLFGEIGKRIVSWLGNIAADVMDWVNTNVVEPILGFLDSIGIPATEIWTAIVGASGELTATVTAWVTENIVNPILGFIDAIATDPQTIWTAIAGGASELVNTVTAWVTENITNPILGFIESIAVDPSTIWTSIVGAANALVATVTTWVKTNIVDPILDIPNQVKDIIAQVVAKLGFSASTPGEVATWVTNIVLYIGSLPGKIVAKGEEIIKALFAGDWAGTIKTILDDWWKILTGWIPGMGGGQTGVTSAIPQPTGPSQPQSQPPSTPPGQKSTGVPILDKQLENQIDRGAGNAGGSPTHASGGPLLFPGGNKYSESPQALFNKPQQPQQTSNVNQAYADTMKATMQAAQASLLSTPKPAAPRTSSGLSNIASGGGTPSNAYQQQNPGTQTLGQSNTDINKLAEQAAQNKNIAKTYEEAKAKLDEWNNAEVQKAGTDEAHLKLGAQALLQTKDLSGIYDSNGKIIEDLTGHVANYGAQLEAKNTVEGQADETNAKLRGTIVGTTLALAAGTLQGKLAEQGYLEQTAAMQKMEVESIKNVSSLNTYANQLRDGRIQQLAFTLGEQEQQKALYDKEVALNKNAGKLSEYAKQLNDGKILSLAFAEGQQAITQQYLSMIEETSNLNGKFAELSTKINDVSQRQIVYNNGLAEGKLKAAEFIQQIDAATGSYDGYRQVLIENAQAMGMTVDATMLGTQAIEDFVAVARGSADAIKELHGYIIDLGSGMMDDLVAGIHEGKSEFNDALDEIEEQIGFKLGKEIKSTIKVAADIQDAVNTVEKGLGLMSVLIQVGADPSQIRTVGDDILKEFESNFEEKGDNVGNGLIDNLKENFEGKAPAITAIFTQLKTNIETIMNSPVGSDAFNTAFQNLKNLFGSLNGDIDNLGQGFRGLEGSMTPPITSANQLGQALKGVGDNGKLNIDFTNNWGQAADVFTGKATAAAEATNSWGTFQDAWRGKADQSITSANQLAQNIDSVKTAAEGASTATNDWSTFQAAWNGTADTGATSATNLATGIADTGTAANTATPEMLAFYAAIANFGTIESVAITIFTVKLPEHAKTGAAAIAVEFQNMLPQIGTHFDAVNNMALFVFGTQVPQSAASGIPLVVGAFSLIPANVAPYFGEVENLALVIFGTNIPTHAANGVPLVVGAFSLLPPNIAPFMGELDALTQVIFEVNIPAHAAAMNPLVTNEFGAMVNLATNQLLVLAQNADKSFKAIGEFAKVVPEAVDKYFGKAADDGIKLIQALQRGSASAFKAMQKDALDTANHVGYIGNAANWAEDQVNSLASALESIPRDIQVKITITTVYKTVGSPSAAARRGQFGLHTTVNEPTLFMAGEGSGPETVQIMPGSGSMVGQNNNVNVDSQVNTQNNVGGSGSIVQTSTNNQVNGVRINGTQTGGGGGSTPTPTPTPTPTTPTTGSGGITVQAGNQTITISENGTVTITQGNQTITTGPNGTSISMGGGIRNTNPNPADSNTNNNNQQNGTVVSGGSIVGQNNQTNVQTDTNTNSNVGGNGTITQTQTNTQNPPGTNQQTQTNTGTSTNTNTNTNTQTGTNGSQSYSQSSTVVSGSGHSVGSGHNISLQRNNSGQTLTIDGQTYQAVSGEGTTSPSETEFRRHRQTGSNAGMGVRTVVEQPLEINVHMDRWKVGRIVRKLMYDVDEGLYK